MKTKHGFTLIEMLVVIGITTVLISLLLPVITAARRSSQNVKCLSNLRQLQQAVVLHAQDHEGYGPLSGYCVGSVNDPSKRKYEYQSGSQPLPTFTALRAALGFPPISSSLVVPPAADPAVQGLFTCPAQETNDGLYGPVMTVGVGIGGAGGTPSASEYTSYAANNEVLGAPLWNSNTTDRPLGKLSRVRRPSDVVLFADTTILGTNGASWWRDINWVGSETTNPVKAHTTVGDLYTWTIPLNHWDAAQSRPDLYRHNGAINFVFVDGHGETVQCRFPPYNATNDTANATLLSHIGLANGIYD